METEASAESLLDLKSPAMMDGESDVVISIEVAEFRKLSSSLRADKRGLA